MPDSSSTTQTVTVLVRDFDRLLVASNIDDWDATTLIACVSSDPRSFHELGLSWLRYRPDSPLDELPWSDTSEEQAHSKIVDDAWLLIDLACLKLESNQTELIPAERGGYQPTDDDWTRETPLVWFNLPPVWRIFESPTSGPQLETPGLPEEPIDFRGVLYGRAMTRHFARKMAQVAQSETLPGGYLSHEAAWQLEPDDPWRDDANQWHCLTMRVHADWLMTERADLGGEAPRVFLHRGREWAEWEEEHRKREWSTTRRPPRPLDRNTHTWRTVPCRARKSLFISSTVVK